jgi:5-methylcytosine-specific restriction endonuclease McrA
MDFKSYYSFATRLQVRNVVGPLVRKAHTYKGWHSYLDIFGCNRNHLIAHFESKFTPKMTWENHGSYWHVDHIIPISSFDLTDPKQCKQANHWTNLQPLEAAANLAKSNTITKPQMSLMLNL